MTCARLRPAPIDFKSLVLTPEEGFVLSRIDGPVDADQVAGLTGLPAERVDAVVVRLIAVGALVIEGDGGPSVLPSIPPGASFSSRPPASGLDPLAQLGGAAASLPPPPRAGSGADACQRPLRFSSYGRRPLSFAGGRAG